MSADDWPEYEYETRDGLCDSCGEARPVQRRCDPFIDEVYGERTPARDWCKACWQARKDDV